MEGTSVASSIAFARAFLPKVPLIGRTAIANSLGLSEHSKYWDLRTEVTINVLRSFIVDSAPVSISKVQRLSLRDPGPIKGRIWISKYATPKPAEDDIRQALFEAIEHYKEPGSTPNGYPEPDLGPVEAEWTGYRAGATPQSVELKISEELKYKELMREAAAKTTILYFHGGAYYLMDPASHRPTTKKLAKLTKGRCFSVRYRLAPQNPFPAALLDALISYFSLLYPLPGAYHEPVAPDTIVFSGDSAGGNLSLVLLQTLLYFHHQGRKIQWNGQARDVPLPAGVAVCSPWLDVTQSSPSCDTNSKYDYLPPSAITSEGMEYPTCALWPATPPRKHIYASDELLCHPLVSPLIAKSWAGSPPLFIETGEELLTDEDKHVATKAAIQGVPVEYEQYETMPHCFAMVVADLPASKRFFDSWAGFITQCVENPKEIRTKGTIIAPRTLNERGVEVGSLSVFKDEEVLKRMKERVQMLNPKQPDSLSKL